jgi:hypothetical protein
VDTGALGATGNAGGPGKARRLATLQARQLLPLVRGEHWLDGRHLDALMTKRRGLLSLSRRLATATLIRLQGHDLLDVFNRAEAARLARMTRLAAPTPPAPGACGTGRLRRITRWRTRSIARILLELLLPRAVLLL